MFFTLASSISCIAELILIEDAPLATLQIWTNVQTFAQHYFFLGITDDFLKGNEYFCILFALRTEDKNGLPVHFSFVIYKTEPISTIEEVFIITKIKHRNETTKICFDSAHNAHTCLMWRKRRWTHTRIDYRPCGRIGEAYGNNHSHPLKYARYRWLRLNGTTS